MQNDDVSSDEGEEGLDENLEPTPVSLPGTSTEGNTSSNNRATAGPSKTWKRKKYDEDEPRSRRSRTTSESMKKLWAQRRANNPNPQNSKQK